MSPSTLYWSGARTWLVLWSSVVGARPKVGDAQGNKVGSATSGQSIDSKKTVARDLLRTGLGKGRAATPATVAVVE